MTASSDTRARGVLKRIAIPDVIGLNIDDAKIVLSNAGFERFRVHYAEDYADEFSVVEQLPRSGMLVHKDSEVLLRISRTSLVNYLPQAFKQSESEGGGNFLRGFLSIVHNIYDSVNLRLGRVHEFFDPRTTDPDFLPWLAGWLAITLNPDWSTLQRRKMLMAATQLFPDRGTSKAIREFVRIYVGANVDIEENQWPFSGFRIGVHSTVGDDTVILPPMNLAHCFVVQLDKPVTAVSDDEIIKIHQIIQNQKPAHTSYYLSFSDEADSGEMGAFMAIGVPAAEVVPEGEAPPAIGMGIGIAIDGTVYDSEGSTGLIVEDEADDDEEDDDGDEAQDAAADKPESGSDSASGAQKKRKRKKKPMVKAKGDDKKS
ncbi:MAG: PASTA domain-containing protein [Myxococcales bacterium]|nr:PASTA domain-containing protein [Myxococcales bacterium]